VGDDAVIDIDIGIDIDTDIDIDRENDAVGERHDSLCEP